MAGRIYKVEKGSKTAWIANELPGADMQPVDELGIDYGTAVELADVGVTFARGAIEPGTEVPGHAGPNLYGLYIISGSGLLTLTDETGKVTSELNYQPDDLIIFEAGAMHGWKNDGETAMEWLGIDIARS